jgi:hypothetical protein
MTKSKPRAKNLARVALALIAPLFACTGNIGPSGGDQDFTIGEGNAGDSGGANPNGQAGSGASSSGGSSGDGQGGSGGTGGAENDAGRVGIHRLNNLEYDNTVRDLLGVDSTPASTFIADEKALGFDNIADAFGMTEAQYEQYFSAADSLVDTAFADPTLRSRIVTCQPSSPTDASCTERIIRELGARAWRRPLEDADVERLEQVAADARTLGESFEGSIAQVTKALISSVPFLYRLELDPVPDSTEPRALDGYELASRLSYLVWSTMPDQPLFDAAESGALVQQDELRAQLARMLASERARNFITSFGGQWLGLRDLRSHQVDTDVFPEWSEELREAMIDEGLYYFSELLHGELPMTEFFTADFNYVNEPLAALYGINGVDGDAPMRVTDATDNRRGFLGLAAFLTRSSFSYRTAPTLRGKWILENLLCEEIQPPPANVPELDDETEPGVDPQSLNVRDRLAQHRENPTCATCHVLLDPMGLGLESFDAIGRYRDEYAGGDPVDATGTLPSGETFDGLQELSAILAEDDRLLDCTTEKLMTYALSRELVEADEVYVDEIRSSFEQDGASLRSLLEHIVLSEPFRNRGGQEAAP